MLLLVFSSCKRLQKGDFHSFDQCILFVSVCPRPLNQPGTVKKKGLQLNEVIAMLLYILLIDMLVALFFFFSLFSQNHDNFPFESVQ